MIKNPPDLYKKYFLDRDFERIDLFEKLVNKFTVKSALYPGSFVHFSPSFLIPYVVYVDSYKKSIPVFDNPQTLSYINTHKKYNRNVKIEFIEADYTNKLNLPEKYFDLLISQYAGLVSHYCKKFLKVGGILVANNSHGDASKAFLDPDYEFIGVINKRSDKYVFSDNNLDDYFIPKKGKQITNEVLLEKMKGIGYTKSADDYIFKRLS